MGLFSQEFNSEIHEELKRVKRTLWASLDLWQYGQVELADVLFDHVLQGAATDEEVNQMTAYFQNTFAKGFEDLTSSARTAYLRHLEVESKEL